jgi:hypothetical protein
MPTDRLCGPGVRVSGYRFRCPGFDYRRYQMFWEVLGLERGPLSLVSTTEELLERNSSGSGLENQDYGRGDPLRWSRDSLYQLKLVLTSPAGCGRRSVGIIRHANMAAGAYLSSKKLKKRKGGHSGSHEQLFRTSQKVLSSCERAEVCLCIYVHLCVVMTIARQRCGKHVPAATEEAE